MRALAASSGGRLQRAVQQRGALRPAATVIARAEMQARDAESKHGGNAKPAR